LAFGKKKEKEEIKKEKVEAPTTEVEKFKRLFALSTQLDKDFNTENTLQRMDSKVIVAVPSIATGLPTFDYTVMQSGGIPRGRIIEIFGPESAGKTSITLHIIAEEQRNGGIAAFVDAEHALDPSYARKLGVNVDKLLISQPSYGEQALTIVERLIESKAVSIIVVDSAAALTPKAELEGEMGDNHVGLQSRMMSQAMRKLAGIAFDNKVTVIFINQIREKIGTMYGNPETTPGGRALKHYASVRIDVRRREAITLSGSKEDKNILGHGIKLKAVKNKVGVPFRETEVKLFYEDGFDKIDNLIEFASDLNLFERAGAWYTYEEQRFQGLAALKEALSNDPKIVASIQNKVKKIVDAQVVVPTGV
jgi:recombination protein RecA